MKLNERYYCSVSARVWLYKDGWWWSPILLHHLHDGDGDVGDGDDDGDVDDDGDDGDDDDVRDDAVDDGDGDACDGGDDGDTEFGIGGDAAGASYLLSDAACTTARYTYKPRLTGMPPRLLVQIVGLMQPSPLWCHS